MENFIPDKVYVDLIDGTQSFVAIPAREIKFEQYEILEDDAYADPDPSLLYAYYPGDIVEVEDSVNWDYQYIAKRLIYPANRPDRDYLEFQYSGTLRKVQITKANAFRYREVIERIKKEISEGHFFYRGVRDTIEGFDRLT